MKKRALLVGINYVGTGNDLRGCINDVNNVHTMLAARGFTVETILEKEATTAGITAGLLRLISGVSAGDVIVFHYSGHGSQLPCTDEPDDYEEIICPIDLDWNTKVITDKTLRDIFNRVPNGVNTTVILDCCHSGTMLNQTDTLQVVAPKLAAFIEPKELIKRYLPPPDKIKKKLAGRKLVYWTASRDVNKGAMLFAGCQANQTSADAFIDGLPQGAATASLIRALKYSPVISHKKLITEMNDFMVVNGFEQRPELDGSPLLYDKTFLDPYAVVTTAPTTPAVDLTSAPTPVPQEPTAPIKPSVAPGVIIVAVLIILFFGFIVFK